MKETTFIEQNKEKWIKFQKHADNKALFPEKIVDLYADITSDLSYAQTFYNKRTVRAYLNQLAQSVHNLVHTNRKDTWKKIFTVWKVSIPLEIYRSRKTLFFALMVFLFWVAVGAFSTLYNPDFPRLILGDSYVEMTLKNIEKGDPLGVYHSDSQISMFLEITLNNIKVSFYAFIFGIFFTVGTHILIFQNAIMLGAFQYFFYAKGLLLTSFLGIWIHGAFEISAIAIAGGAGIILGNGLLFPKSYTRLQSLQIAAKRGLKIMISLIPFLIAAGFLEGFVTHNYLSFPDWTKWFIILMSFSIILAYFVIYPVFVARKYPELVHENDPPVRTLKSAFDLTTLRNFGQIFSDSFAFYRRFALSIFKTHAPVTLPIIAGILIFQDYRNYGALKHQYEYDWSSQLSIMMGFKSEMWSDFVVTLLWSFLLTYLTLAVYFHLSKQQISAPFQQFWSFVKPNFLKVLLSLTLLFLILFYLPWQWMFLVMFLVPLFWINSAVACFDTKNNTMKGRFRISSRNYGKNLLSILILSLVLFLIAQPIAFVFSYQNDYMSKPEVSDFLDYIADFVKNVARYYTEDFVVPASIVRQIVYTIFILFTLPVFVVMMGFLYFNYREAYESNGLREKLKNFGSSNKKKETTADFD